MTYVLVRSDGKYVARSGSASSYTSRLEKAETFPTREAAEANRCEGNESVRAVNDIVGRG